MSLLFLRRERALALAFALWSAILIVSSTPHLVGDGIEYVTMAEKLARFETTAMTIHEAQTRHLTGITTRARDRWHEFVHFWVYPALAVPFVWITKLIDVTPLAAFTILNLACLGALFFVGQRRISLAGLLFIVAGPIWWWIDKAHTEVFTYSLLSAAFFCLPAQAHLSTIAIGLAATQNPPIVALLPLFAWQAWRTGTTSRKTMAICVGVAIGIAALHPAYYLHRMGRFTALANTDDVRWPSLDLIGYVLWDPNVGLLFNAPWALLIVLLGSVALLTTRARRTAESSSPLTGQVLIAGVAASVFLLAFAQTPNQNHGGTVGMSRYALWLIPLTIPFWRALDRTATWRVIGAGVAVVSTIWTVVFFRPSLPEQFRDPSRVALYLWTRYPSLNNPLPEIFAERLGHRELAPLSVATPGCEKALMTAGEWPSPCEGPPAPPVCRLPDALCYANRVGADYVFVPTTMRGSARPWDFRRAIGGQ